MDLKDVEISLGIQFPKLFHEVHNSGMTFFGEMMGDCQMIAFEELRSAYDDLYECLNFDLEIYPERHAVNPRYRLIPFARRISGDKYCFLYTWYQCEKPYMSSIPLPDYEEVEDEPKVVVYGHDTGDVDLWADNFEEFVYFQIVEAVAEWDKPIHSDYIKAHVLWLNDGHKQLLSGHPINELWDKLPEPQEFNIWI